jgi:hypothetical protein
MKLRYREKARILIGLVRAGQTPRAQKKKRSPIGLRSDPPKEEGGSYGHDITSDDVALQYPFRHYDAHEM